MDTATLSPMAAPSSPLVPVLTVAFVTLVTLACIAAVYFGGHGARRSQRFLMQIDALAGFSQAAAELKRLAQREETDAETLTYLTCAWLRLTRLEPDQLKDTTREVMGLALRYGHVTTHGALVAATERKLHEWARTEAEAPNPESRRHAAAAWRGYLTGTTAQDDLRAVLASADPDTFTPPYLDLMFDEAQDPKYLFDERNALAAEIPRAVENYENALSAWVTARRT